MTDASPLAKKLKLKPGQHAAIINAPEGYPGTLLPLPDGTEITTDLAARPYDWLLLFAADRAALDRDLPAAVDALKPEALLWLAFPKGSSKRQSDLTRDKGWEAVPEDRLLWITLVSLDAYWSAFSLRPLRPGELPRPRLGGR